VRRVAIACALALTVLLLVGLAAAWPGDGRKDAGGRAFDSFLADVARRLEVEPAKLRGAIEGAALDRVDRAAAADRISERCADFLRERIRSGQLGPLLRLVAPGLRPDRRWQEHKRPWRGWFGAHSKTEILDSVKTRLDEAVEQSRLTRDRADRILERVRAKLERERGDKPAHACARR
jgi:hypothetical protein